MDSTRGTSKKVLKSAYFSEDGKYRYILYRGWDLSKPHVVLIMFNPSTADATQDDPTIQRVGKILKSAGFGHVSVVNLYGCITKYPKKLEELKKDGIDIVGKDNITHVKSLISKADKADKVIYAWGQNEREPEWLKTLVKEPLCLAVSKKGNPGHPLYLKKDTKPIPYKRNN